MGIREMMKNTPGWVWATCGTVVFVTITAAFVFLSATGADATEFRTFLNTVLNFAGVLLAGTSAIAAGAAAKSAANTEKQTNGVLTHGIQDAINSALSQQSEASNAAVQTTYDKGVSDGRPSV